ncbi:Uncharacterized protein FKW44_013859 [Caligus rogercresseyi]|uniref:Uncharacterized protein n=1 Tax=Caligus rogercresseyi TaxID=217165 RepID=A0A7T8GY54_CALRO|nr:Uncharacterized protein FKW44_013859 [Caligus rogercresseyi]
MSHPEGEALVPQVLPDGLGDGVDAHVPGGGQLRHGGAWVVLDLWFSTFFEQMPPPPDLT